MDAEQLQRVEARVRQDPTNVVLGFSLGTAYFRLGRFADAAEIFQRLVAQHPTYSAAYRGLGRALAKAGQVDEARQAYERGIPVAQAQGDLQIMKELRVFLKQLERPGA